MIQAMYTRTKYKEVGCWQSEKKHLREELQQRVLEKLADEWSGQVDHVVLRTNITPMLGTLQKLLGPYGRGIWYQSFPI
jgi:hypothetical protein